MVLVKPASYLLFQIPNRPTQILTNICKQVYLTPTTYLPAKVMCTMLPISWCLLDYPFHLGTFLIFEDDTKK